MGFEGPGGGPLDPDRDLVTVPGGFRSRPTERLTKNANPKYTFRDFLGRQNKHTDPVRHFQDIASEPPSS